MITIIEKHLDKTYGHWLSQIKAVESLAKDENLIILTACNSNVLLPPAYNIKRVLSTRREQKKKKIKALQHDVSVLKNIIRQSNDSKNFRILVPTAEKHELLVCMDLLAQNSTKIVFTLRVLTYQCVNKLTKSERASLQGYVEAGLIKIVTETEALSELLRSKYRINAQNKLLLPCSVDPKDNAPHHEARIGSHFKIGYLGGGRKEQGLDKLPQIFANLKNLLNNFDKELSFELVMQTPKHKTRLRKVFHDYKMRRSLRNTVKSQKKINLTLLPEELSTEKFVATIHSVDFLLIPYNLKAYKARGSGIIIDGVLAAKPIVYTNGIGMEEFLIFGNAEAATDSADFALKIMAMVQNFDAYRAKTLLARDAILAQIRKSADTLAEGRSPNYDDM
jgi:glycosyltransferase involved in cell wall biosynthesis